MPNWRKLGRVEQGFDDFMYDCYRDIDPGTPKYKEFQRIFYAGIIWLLNDVDMNEVLGEVDKFVKDAETNAKSEVKK